MQWIIDIVKLKLASYLKNKIFLWSGAIVDIPAGWALCDGAQGTPNLRSSFIVGAGSSFSPGGTGGDVSHAHGYSLSGLFHQIIGGTNIQSGSGYHNKTTTHLFAGNTASAVARPPYYALAFIMKL